MTLAEAKEVLTKPKFGDPRCIEAANVLRDEAVAVELRKQVIGKRVFCGPCGGKPGGCKYCEDGAVTITKELAATWDRDILEGVLEDIGCPD